ncbi:MAG: DUF4230 domain-containing protein [Planctomycetota bacterium]
MTPRPGRPRHGRVLATLLVLLLLAGAVLAAYWYGTRARPATRFRSTGPTVQQLESLGHLTVLKLSLADVLEGNGYGYKGAWLIRGDALYAVDMRRAEITSRDDAARTATIRLPQPSLLQPRVDHNKTLTYAVERTTWIPGTGDQSRLRDESMKEAQGLIERAASRDEYTSVARQNTELLLEKMYGLVEWDVEIDWSSGVGAGAQAEAPPSPEAGE